MPGQATAPRAALPALRELDAGASPAAWWRASTAADWPDLFPRLAIAADLPRLDQNLSLANLPLDLWPELGRVRDDVIRLQRLVDHPAVPAAARIAPVFSAAESDAAVAALADSHCVTLAGLLSAAEQRELDAAVADLARDKMGSWGELQRDQAPALFTLSESALESDLFRRLTGFDLERDEFTLTLSLQDLDPGGIGWHRDLYWPKEWVGEDVFAVLYALGDDSPAKGGAFLYYAPAEQTVYAVYRRRHQATVVWNGRTVDGRPLHAVSNYLGADTSRHLLILQCHRRA